MALEQFQTNELPEEIPAEVPEAPKQATREKAFADDATVRLQQKRREYDLHLQNLIDKASQRQLNYNPKLLALGAGLLTPGKTGNFFEGLGLGAKGYMEAGEKEVQTEMERAKLENELRTGQIGQLEKDYALQKDLEGKQYLRDVLSGKIGQDGALVKPTTLAGNKMTVPDAYALIESAQTTGKRITPAMIAAAPTKETRDFIEKMYDNQQKEAELEQKEFGSAPRLVMGEEMKLNVDQSRKLSILEKKTLDLVREGQMTSETRDQIINQFLIDQKIVKGTTSKTPEGTTKPSFETPADIAQRREIEKTQSVEDIKAAKDVQKKDIETIGKETKSAKLQELAARDMFTFASDPALDKMFGVLNSKPGYTSAFFLALKEPVRIGNTSIGVGQIEDILRLANIKDPAVIAAAERFKGLSKQIEANETRILLGGEGQITEGERRIVTAIVPTLSDPKEVVKAKAELTIARAQFDQERAKAFNAYTRQNKNATYFDFESDPNSPYQKLWSNYREHTADIADSYSKSGTKTKRDSSATSAKSTSPVKSGGLWEAIQRAKEAE
jgi:hypothetical protein